MVTKILMEALVVVGLLFMTLGIFGMIRMPDIYTKLHAASKSVFLGVIMLTLAAMLVGDDRMVMRLVLLGVLVLITTPVSSHAIGRGAYIHHERMVTPGALDESHSHLARDESRTPSWRL